VSEPPDGTPLDPDEAAALRLSWVRTQADLNFAEAANIAAGMQWASGRHRTPAEILDDLFLRQLHGRMFGDVWQWAGQYRTSEKNIGTTLHWQIGGCVRDLVGDVLCWVADSTPAAWPADEICVRFHHRLVWVHPFSNGNGRHSRAAADLLGVALGIGRLNWGGGPIPRVGGARDRYLDALRAADRGDMEPLLAFVRKQA